MGDIILAKFVMVFLPEKRYLLQEKLWCMYAKINFSRKVNIVSKKFQRKKANLLQTILSEVKCFEQGELSEVACFTFEMIYRSIY